MGLAVIGWLGCLTYFGGENPSCSAHQRELFAALPFFCSVNAALRRCRMRVAARGQPISAEKHVDAPVDRMKVISVLATAAGSEWKVR
jgi:hypothetical protein